MTYSIHEDFLPDWEATRREALAAGFIDWPGPDGETYKRIAMIDAPWLKDAIEARMGPVTMLGGAFRLNYAGEVPNHAIHSDMGWGTHALVLYLCHGEGGTAFWRHQATGATRIEAGDVDLFHAIDGAWDDESQWDLCHVVPIRPNRAVIYESANFHSRYPFAAFGDSPETGRLIAVAFFTPLTEQWRT